MLFFCSFDELTPLLVDGSDEAHAREIATAAADGAAPARVVPIPAGVFVAELFTEDEDGAEIVVDPLPHVVDHLEKIDAALCGDVVAEDDAAACGEEAEHAGEVVGCHLDPGHAGPQHEGITSDGQIVYW